MAFYDPDDDAFDPSTYGSQQRSYLPRARKESVGGALSQKSADAAFQRYMELAGGKDDYSEAQMQALERSKQANMDDRLAIAAQYAGPRFAGMQESYLKRAMAGREPTRVGDVTIGPYGTVVKDVGADRMKQAELQFRLGQNYSQTAEREDRKAERDYQIGRDEDQRDYQRKRNEALDADRAAGSWTTNYGDDGSVNQANSKTGVIRTIKQPTTTSYIPDVSGQSALIIKPDVDMSEATGLYGRAVRTASQVGDTVGLGNPDQANRIATNALNALALNTQAIAASAFGGKDSVRLLDAIENQLIRPNNISSGAAEMESKARSIMGVLQSGMKAKSNILNNPEGSTAGEVSKARTDYIELNQLHKEYEALLKSLPSASDTLDDDFNKARDALDGVAP